MELLLDRGADLEAKDIVGQTTLLLRGGSRRNSRASGSSDGT